MIARRPEEGTPPSGFLRANLLAIVACPFCGTDPPPGAACRCGATILGLDGHLAVSEAAAEAALDPEAVAAWRQRQLLLRSWRDTARPAREASVWAASREVAAKYLDLPWRTPRTGRVLDVGCGSARRCRHMPGKCYVGIDADNAPAGGAPIAAGLAEFLPFRPASFDAVLAVESIDHVVDPARVVGEMARVLVAGGGALVFVGAGGHPNHAGRQALYPISEDRVHGHAFSPSSLRTLLAPAFDVVEVDVMAGYLAGWGYRAREHADE